MCDVLSCTMSAEEKAAKRRNKEIEKQMEEDDKYAKNDIKLLLLGKYNTLFPGRAGLRPYGTLKHRKWGSP